MNCIAGIAGDDTCVVWRGRPARMEPLRGCVIGSTDMALREACVWDDDAHPHVILSERVRE